VIYGLLEWWWESIKMTKRWAWNAPSIRLLGGKNPSEMPRKASFHDLSHTRKSTSRPNGRSNSLPALLLIQHHSPGGFFLETRTKPSWPPHGRFRRLARRTGPRRQVRQTAGVMNRQSRRRIENHPVKCRRDEIKEFPHSIAQQQFAGV
jgi:hypothetical protein